MHFLDLPPLAEWPPADGPPTVWSDYLGGCVKQDDVTKPNACLDDEFLIANRAAIPALFDGWPRLFRDGDLKHKPLHRCPECLLGRCWRTTT